MQNFAYPYFARDIAEFWQRWHISLTTWFRDYLYIPLGGSRCTRLKQIRNTYAVFLVSGLWHGANWTFILWGLFHVTLFLPLLLLKKNRKHLDSVASGRLLPNVRECAGILRTFLLTAVGWAFFRAQSVGECFTWFNSFFDFTTWRVPSEMPREVWTAIGAVAFLIIVEWINRGEIFGFAKQPASDCMRWLFYLLIVGLVVFYTPGGSSFIYFQF
jgi:D-alanyl-lipoteichoic acid acyltransferase DltB (MBOAT superfamily)